VVGGAAPTSHGFKECQCDCVGEVARFHDRAAWPEFDQVSARKVIGGPDSESVAVALDAE
jgi:hypothetical protein